MYKSLKMVVLLFGKYLGLFWLSRCITKKGLRILCYHNFSRGDLIQWRPKLYIHPQTLNRRLSYLRRMGFQILPLNVSLEQLYSCGLSDLTVAVTVDDGWHRTLKYADPLFKEHKIPYTIYACTYHSIKATPVFNIVVQYMFWKGTLSRTNSLKEIGVECEDWTDKESVIGAIQKYGDFKLNHVSRDEFLYKLGSFLGVDYNSIVKSKRFHLLTIDEMDGMIGPDVDFQLHSHRHRWPVDRQYALREIEDNRRVLETITNNKLVHFCYPSGLWTNQQFVFLKAKAIVSAVTCEAGLNYPNTQPYRLNRFLDGENISQLEFEAEMSGFLELMRKIKRFISRVFLCR